MKRTDITALFPEATDEQIKKLMDLNGSDVNDAKRGGEDIKRQLAEALGQLEAAKKASEGAPSADELTKARDQAAKLERELTQLKLSNQLRELRETVAKEKGVPAELLTGENEDACKAQADGILAFSKSRQAYPKLPDGGEAGSAPQGATRDRFVSWAQGKI